MIAKLEKEIYSLKNEIAKIGSIKDGLYSDYKLNVISLEDYKEMNKRLLKN